MTRTRVEGSACYVMVIPWAWCSDPSSPSNQHPVKEKNFLSLRWRRRRTRRHSFRDTRRWRLCGKRQLDAESGAVPRRVGNGPASAKLRDQLPHDAQAQTRACWRVTPFAESHERLPDPVAIGARDPWPFVVDTQALQAIRATRFR